MTDIKTKFAKAWYNPKIKGYELYDPQGLKIGFGTLEATVSISDNWGVTDKIGLATFTLNCVCQIVNEEPQYERHQFGDMFTDYTPEEE